MKRVLVGWLVVSVQIKNAWVQFNSMRLCVYVCVHALASWVSVQTMFNYIKDLLLLEALYVCVYEFK